MEDFEKIRQEILESRQNLPSACWTGCLHGVVYLAWQSYPGRGVMGTLQLTFRCPYGKCVKQYFVLLGCN